MDISSVLKLKDLIEHMHFMNRHKVIRIIKEWQKSQDSPDQGRFGLKKMNSAGFGQWIKLTIF